MNEGPGCGWNRAGYKLTVTVAARLFVVQKHKKSKRLDNYFG